MAKTQYLDYAGLQELVTQIKNADTATLNAAKAYVGTLPEGQTNAITYLMSQITDSEFSGDAKDVKLEDTAGNFTSKDVESALAQLAQAIAAVDYSGKADKVASATAGNFAGLDAQGNLVDSGKKAADFEVAGEAAKVQGSTTKTVKDVEDLITVLVGSDANKSARTIAAEELAAKLIPEDAKESLDTLEEIAAWIQAHPDDASNMNKAIQDLQAQVGKKAAEGQPATGIELAIANLQEAVGEGGSVADAIKNAIEDLDATASQTAGADGLALSITEVDGKITAISGSIAANTYEAYGEAAKVQGATTETVASVDTKVSALESLVGDGYEPIPVANVTALFA